MPALLATYTDWYCPNCGKTDRTSQSGPHTRFHTCPRLRFLSAPMLRKGTAAKVVLTERQDYVGGELVRLDPERGRPIQNITTVRDSGQDCIVFAPTARAGAHA
jgi:hypothetical protein